MTDGARKDTIGILFLVFGIIVLVCTFAWTTAHNAEGREELHRRKEADALQHCVNMHGTAVMRYDQHTEKFALSGCEVPAPLER